MQWTADDKSSDRHFQDHRVHEKKTNGNWFLDPEDESSMRLRKLTNTDHIRMAQRHKSRRDINSEP
jgi:hypothetical protein